MYVRYASAILAFFLCVFAGTGGARAQTSNTVAYSPGWNMVGGPPGTDLSNAQAIEMYAGPDYQVATTKQTALCEGYWAYFATQVSVSLSGTAVGSQQSCPVQAGWTLVGNPFRVPAGLPAGMTAYAWNPTQDSYATVTSIPVGGAVWIYATSAGSVMLQASQASSATATFVFGRQGGNIIPYQVTINSDGAVSASGPVTVHPVNGRVSPQQLAALLAQAENDQFFTMPAQTNCPGTLPDVASLFIQIDAPSVTAQPHRVEVHGNCVAAFSQLFAALQAAVAPSP